MSAPIYDTLTKYLNKHAVSFHTPGHKACVLNSLYKDFFNRLIDFDLTELPETDNLLIPTGAIKESEKKASKIFGSKKTIYSTFGCTLCIQAMIKIASTTTTKIIADRTIHKSAINTFALLNLDVVWLYPDNKNINAQEEYLVKLETLIKQNPDAGAIYITTPNYYGEMLSVGKIADICHKYNRVLLVDNAHGSHLYFVDAHFKKALQKADMVACSLHKTLPVMTGGAILNINNGDCCSFAEEAFSLFSGTSPSYPVMTSIDLCMDFIEKQEPFFLKKYVYSIDYLKQIAKDKKLLVESVMPIDPFRIVLSANAFGINGSCLSEKLRAYGIEPEFSDSTNVVLILTFTNSEADFKKLETFMRNFNAVMLNIEKSEPYIGNVPITEKALTLRQALFSSFEVVDIENAINKISFDCVCHYPPGIPIILPGEIINDSAIQLCLKENIKKIKVVYGR